MYTTIIRQEGDRYVMSRAMSYNKIAECLTRNNADHKTWYWNDLHVYNSKYNVYEQRGEHHMAQTSWNLAWAATIFIYNFLRTQRSVNQIFPKC